MVRNILSNVPALESLDLSTLSSTLYGPIIQAHHSATLLELIMDAGSFVSVVTNEVTFPSLLRLNVTSSAYTEIASDLSWVNETMPVVEWITLKPVLSVGQIGKLPHSTLLASLFYNDSSLNITLPPRLKHLELYGREYAAGLTSLEIYSETKSLKTLVLGKRALNGPLVVPESIESLHMPGSEMYDPVPRMPNLVELTTKTNISFLPFHSSLTQLSYDTIIPLSMETLPPNLTHLYGGMMDMSDLAVAPEDMPWDDWFSSVPLLRFFELSNLRQVGYFPGLIPTTLVFPGEALMERLPNLEALGWSNDFSASSPPFFFSGTIPPAFFYRLPNLVKLDLSGNNMSGTIPWFGMENVEHLDLRGNAFSSWPSINATLLQPGLGPPLKLKVLKIGEGTRAEWAGEAERVVLPSIPDESSWLWMTTSLKTLLFVQYPLANSAVPFAGKSDEENDAGWQQVWGQRAALQTADLSGLQGPLPRLIDSPSLQELIIAGGICSALPSLGNKAVLQKFEGCSAPLFGSIPPSWASTDLAFNDLSVCSEALYGEIPALRLYGAMQRLLLFHLLSPFNGSLSLDFSSVDAAQLNFEMKLFSDVRACHTVGTSGTPTSLRLPIDACNCTSLWPGMHSPSAVDCLRAMPPAVAPTECLSLVPPLSFSSSLPIPPLPPYRGIVPSIPSTPPSHSPSTSGYTVVIPPNTHLFFPGNTTFPGSISFSGTNSSLTVDGCIFLTAKGTPVLISLSQADFRLILNARGSLLLTLIRSLNGNLCPSSSNLANTKIAVKKSFGGCAKVKAVNSSKSTKASLVVAFSIDNSLCHVAIIVPVVVGSILILTAAIIVIVYAYKRHASQVSLSKLAP